MAINIILLVVLFSLFLKKAMQFEEIKRILSTDLEDKNSQEVRRPMNTKSQSHSPNNVHLVIDQN